MLLQKRELCIDTRRGRNLCNLHRKLQSPVVPFQYHRNPKRSLSTAAQKSYYEVLEIDQSATDKEIKAAYRKKALKLHPDVNKAADAQQRFLEVKKAFETLSDSKTRSQYDRTLRGGFQGGFNYGSSFSGSSQGKRTSYTSEPEYSLEDFFNDVDKELKAWSGKRAGSKAPKSLLEELMALGEEFVDFVEDSLVIDGQSSAKPGTTGKAASGPGSAYDDLLRTYGLNSEEASGASSSSGSKTDKTASSAKANSPAQSSSARPSSTPSSNMARNTSQTSNSKASQKDDDIDDMLAQLKKKLGKA